jgi:hypothetical protein
MEMGSLSQGPSEGDEGGREWRVRDWDVGEEGPALTLHPDGPHHGFSVPTGIGAAITSTSAPRYGPSGWPEVPFSLLGRSDSRPQPCICRSSTFSNIAHRARAMAQWDRVAIPGMVEPRDLGALKEVIGSTRAEGKQFLSHSSKTGRGFRSPARDAELGELF